LTAANGPGMLGRQDLHAHSTLSDGDLPPERVAELAAERGVEIGIADHVSARNAERFVGTLEAVERYLAIVGELPVFLAGEFCWCDALWKELPDEVLDRFDYRIGSNHGFVLPGGDIGSPWWKKLPDPWHLRPQEVIEAMVDNLCEMVRTMPIQIAAHSTLTPPALYALEPDVHAWWTDEREDRWVEALAQSGVAMEISNRYRLPHDRLLAKARQAGVRFTLGSDGHTEAQVGRLEWAAETARRVGITDAHLWIPERRRRA
jgi:histidinol phosphatase-like PHP family hydrolase